MQINTRLQNRIGYRFIYADMISESEEELYWSAVEDAEVALVRIQECNENRLDENDNITLQLLIDQIREVSRFVDLLDESMETIQDIIEKAANRERKAQKWGVEDAWEPRDQQ